MRTAPEPNKHLVHFCGAYANRVRRTYHHPIRHEQQPTPTPTRRCRAANKRWRELVYRVYEVDPLICDRCVSEMKVLAFITDPGVIRKILDHRNKTPLNPGLLPLELKLTSAYHVNRRHLSASKTISHVEHDVARAALEPCTPQPATFFPKSHPTRQNSADGTLTDPDTESYLSPSSNPTTRGRSS